MKSELRVARESAHLTRRQVCAPLQRTTEWLRRVESGSLPATVETRAKIFRVIETLAAVRAEFQKQTGEQLRVILNEKTKQNDGTATRA